MTEEKTNGASEENKPDVLPMGKPEFYHERISYKMAREFMRWHSELGQCQMVLQSKAKDDATPEERQTVNVAISDAFTKIDELTDKVYDFLSSIIKSLPRQWLVEGAPAKIKDGEWLDHVRGDYYSEVLHSYQISNNRRREDSKN